MAKTPTFLLLAVLTQHTECEDPRDRIYSLWNLAKECKYLPAKADYSKSTGEVFTEFTQACTMYTQSLDLMCTVQIPLRGIRNADVPR